MADQPIDDTAGTDPVSPATGAKTHDALKQTLEKALERESETLGLSDEELRKISGGTGTASGNLNNAAVRR